MNVPTRAYTTDGSPGCRRARTGVVRALRVGRGGQVLPPPPRGPPGGAGRSVRATAAAGPAGRGEAAVAADVGLAALQRGRPPQRAQDVVRRMFGDLHQRVPLVDLDRADVAARQARLVRQRTHDVLR